MDADTSPTARALLALEALQNSPGITADRLAERLGVTDRAARRYVSILREAGIPVESSRGPYGGYRLGRGVRLPPLTFSTVEALGLVMAVLDGHHDPDSPDPVGTALGKLVRVLPRSVASQVDAVRRSTATAPDRAAARPEPETTATLVGASAGRRRVRITYRSEAGNVWDVEIDPWVVVVRHGRWYVICWAHRPGARRALRVDRIQQIEVLDHPFREPEDLDPVATLEELLAVGWEYRTEVLLEAPLEEVRSVGRTLGHLESLNGTTTRLTGTTSNPYWYAAQLVLAPIPFRVVGGPELQEATEQLGRRMLRASGAAGSR